MGKTATQPDPLSAEAPEEPETGPHRRCLVTRASLARETMLRFVVGPGNEIVFDALATLPGRGLWLSADANVVEQAIKRGAFARAAKTSVKLPPDLRSRIEFLIRSRLTDLLGLARRSGNAISGFEKAREWLVSGRAGLIVQAADGSPEERARFVGGSKIPVVTASSAAALGKIFGRDHAVHVAIASGRLARMIEIEAARLAGVAGNATSGQ
jgi:predicted RNA-binding protein YlxR (DUF448 family)/ribosomal protein L30E